MKIGDVVVTLVGDKNNGPFGPGKIKKFTKWDIYDAVVVVTPEDNKSHTCLAKNLMLYKDYKKLSKWQEERQ